MVVCALSYKFALSKKPIPRHKSQRQQGNTQLEANQTVLISKHIGLVRITLKTVRDITMSECHFSYPLALDRILNKFWFTCLHIKPN